MFKRQRLTLRQAHRALDAYRQIPIRFSDVRLPQALQISKDLDIYAYDECGNYARHELYKEQPGLGPEFLDELRAI